MTDPFAQLKRRRRIAPDSMQGRLSAMKNPEPAPPKKERPTKSIRDAVIKEATARLTS